MVCPSCGRVVQPNATSCINVSCTDYQRPFTAAERQASRSRPQAPTAPMRPLRGPANAAVACIATVALSSAIAIPLGRLAAPGPLTPTWAAVDLLIVAVAVAGAVCFVTWLFQARRNLDALPTTHPFWAKSWSIGVWFMPVGQAFMPALVVTDIAQETVADPDDPRRARIVALARGWWVSFVVATFFLYIVIGGRAPRSSNALDVPTVTQLIPLQVAPAHPASTAVVYVTVACLLASAATCVAFIRRLTALQELRFQPAPDVTPVHA
jgi:hypothetical protein